VDIPLLKAQGRYHLLRGELFRSALAMGKLKHRLPYEEVQDYRLQLNDLECNHKRMLQIRTRRAQENPNDDYVLMNFAESLWRTGNQEAAVKIATKALKIQDETLQMHLVDEAMIRSRRSLLLAMVGRVEEARAELERTRNLPLCEHCEYCRCKDADIFEAQIEELLGNTQRAKELYLTGKDNWPDEPDFLSGLARMKKKGK
jgi:tetratricopeptide (TPR) repeat protein